MDAEGVAGGYEPLSRWGHVSVSLQGKVYMWGGRTKDFSESQQRKLASSVEVFDCRTETWVTKTTRGTPPKGLYNSAYTLQGNTVYVYGGWDGQKAHNSLFQLNLSTFEWAEVKAENPGRAPTEISGCGLVACGNRKLALFGGYGAIKEKKEKKKAKAKVDERYSLVTVEDEVAKPAEQDESEPVENGGEELKATDDEMQQKVEDNGTNNMTEQNAKDSTKEEKVESSTKEDSKTEQKLRDPGKEEKDNVNEAEEKSRENGDDDNTKEKSSLNGGDVTENGLVESVMAEIEERERAESIGGMEGGKDEETKNKEGEEVDAGSEGGEDGKEEGEREKDRGSEGCGEDSGTVVHAEGEAKTTKDANVKIIDVVNEHVSDKSQKAVVIKLPAVSFRLPDEATGTATGESEGGTSVDETGERVAAETSTAVSQPAELEQPANVEQTGGGEKEEEEEEKEDIEECNTTISVYKRSQEDVKGWTNEVKVFDLDTRMWSSQPTSGSLPPPSVDFSFTSPDKKKAVVFGGYQPPTGITYDTFLLDMETWVWTKLSGESETVSSPSQRNPSLLSHPSARDGHSACVIEGAPRPLMLVTGGWDATDQATNDMWLLDINSGLWKQIMGGKEMGCRFWHTTLVSQSSSRMRQLLTFGGCPGAPESHTTGSWPKMADTVLMEMGKIPSLQGQFSGDGEDRWIVVDTVTRKGLGDPVRRLQETVLLTSFRAQRAESLMKTMIKKMSALGGATQQRKVRGSVSVPTPEEVVEKKEEEVKRPFWQKATDEIQMTYEEIGRGRFSVVKVAIFHETRVAARCLYTRIQSEKDRLVFTECLELAAQLRHPNLVSFMGAVLDREPVIITELMSCNLRSVLEKSALTYYQVVDVAEGVSKALQYLHSVKPHPVVHGELTSTGVLLEADRGPRMKAKLCDYMTAKYFHHLLTSAVAPATSMEDVFAHSREHPSQEYKSRVVRRSSSHSRSGSPLDAADRPMRISQFRKTSTVSGISPLDAGTFSTQRDVYLFGILVVEMATRTAVLEVSLQYLIESIAWGQVAGLVKKCLTHDVDARPDMTEVVSHVMQLASSKP